MKTAFVTGGAGFLGLNLIDHLVAENWDIVAMDLKVSKLRHYKNFGVRAIEGDIKDCSFCE